MLLPQRSVIVLRCVCKVSIPVQFLDIHCTGVRDGGQGEGTCHPNFRNKYLSSKCHEKFGHFGQMSRKFRPFSVKCHVKF